VQLLLPLNRNQAYTRSVFLGAIISVGANLILIPLAGALGAAVATVLTEFSVTAYQLHAVRDFISRRQLFTATWKYLLSGLLMFSLLHLLPVHNFAGLILAVSAGGLTYLIALKLLAAPVLNELTSFGRKIGYRFR
jgi:O-antigen/teichoic acid export membrane protein